MPKSSTQPSASTAGTKVPRPMNCFLAFRLEKQNEIVSRCPGANHRDISKIIAKYWRETSEEEKEPYRRRAYLAKLEHEKAYPNYKYQPQKKSGRKTRKYVRKVKDTFTSRNQGNNRLMELFYKNPRLLDDPNTGDSVTASPILEHRNFNSMCAVANAQMYSTMCNPSVAPTTPSPLMSDANSPMTIEESTLSCFVDQDSAFVVDPLYIQQPYTRHLGYPSVLSHATADLTPADFEAAMPTMHTAACLSMPFTNTYFDPLTYYGHPMNSCIDPQILSCQQEIDPNSLEYPDVKQFKQDDYYGCYEPYYPQL